MGIRSLLRKIERHGTCEYQDTCIYNIYLYIYNTIFQVKRKEDYGSGLYGIRHFAYMLTVIYSNCEKTNRKPSCHDSQSILFQKECMQRLIHAQAQNMV